jgi:hypothetical protein
LLIRTKTFVQLKIFCNIYYVSYRCMLCYNFDQNYQLIDILFIKTISATKCWHIVNIFCRFFFMILVLAQHRRSRRNRQGVQQDQEKESTDNHHRNSFSLFSTVFLAFKFDHIVILSLIFDYSLITFRVAKICC